MTTSTRRGAVLIVDDDPDIRASLRDVIADERYEVAEAGDGRQALGYLRGHEPPCVVILDLMMPVMDGWQFLRALRSDAALANIAVVVVSAATQDRIDDAAKLGVEATLRKPVHLDALLEVLGRFCRPGPGSS